MPSIADSTIQLDNNTIINPGVGVAPPVAAPSPVIPLRGILPPSQVLSPVTVKAVGTTGGPTNLLWQGTPPTNNVKTALSTSVPSGSSSSTPPTAPPAGIPAQVYDLVATQAPYKAPSGIMESLVAVSYHKWTGDPYFAGVQVWFTGYNGVQQPQLMAAATGEDPIEFTCESTGETVTVTVVAYGSSGLTASFASAPTTTVTLSGVVSAPPPPTIAQPVTAISGGWQFQWNVLSGLLEDEIDGYWVYKSATDTIPTPPLNRIYYVKQPGTNVGVITYQDMDSSTEYFWVSAVNTTGLESVLAAANVTVISNSYYPSTDSGGYSNPGNAFDGNQTTSSNATESASSNNAGGPANTATEIWSGFSGYIGTATNIVLNILSQVFITRTQSGGQVPCSASAALEYSLNGGSTFTSIYSAGSSRAQQVDSITLPSTQDLTQVQIRATAEATPPSSLITNPRTGGPVGSSSSSVTQYIYEISISVTQNET